MSDSEDHQTDQYSKGYPKSTTAEIERLQQTEPEDWNEEKDAEFYQLLMDPAPDYEETRARLGQLNARLENEPAPQEDDGQAGGRKPRIRFSENLVQVAPTTPENESAPPPERGTDSEGADPEEARNSSTSGGDQDSSPRSKKVVVVNDGKIRYVNKSDVEADEAFDISDDEESGEGAKPGRNSRAKSASSTANRQRGGGGGDRQQNNRAGSAKAARPEEQRRRDEQDEERRRENSAAFDAWLRRKREQQRTEAEQRQRQRQASAKSADDKSPEDNEAAYQSWLARKRQKAEDERRQREQAERDEEERRRQRDGEKDRISFEQWLAAKREHRRRGEDPEAEEAGSRGGSDQHSQEDCRRAFKQWLRRKEEQRRQEEKLERQRARITRLALRRSRKSQALANALMAADSYRYLDYHGYR
uniref:Coiled-coil domain-containing protein 181 n=1 Tax=Macrostomum lignano TaxID=282301 RepID=A0A1I8HJC0_9PLAT